MQAKGTGSFIAAFLPTRRVYELFRGKFACTATDGRFDVERPARIGAIGWDTTCIRTRGSSLRWDTSIVGRGLLSTCGWLVVYAVHETRETTIEGFLVSSRWSVVFLPRPSSLATRAVEVHLPPQEACPNLWIGRRITCDACRRTATNPRRSSLIGPWESDPDRPYPPTSHRYLSFRLDAIVRSHREQRPCGVDPPALETPRLCGSCSSDRIFSHPSLKNLRGWTDSCHVVSVNPRWVVVRPGAHRRRRQRCLRHRTVSFPSTAEAGEDSSGGDGERCSVLRGTCSGDGFGG